MITLCAPKIPFEYEVIRRWWTIPVGSRLPLTDGRTLELVFPGLPGGPSGPDVRDAIFSTLPTRTHKQQIQTAQRLIGDIEFHTHAREWWSHGHENDARYNNVILHVILINNNEKPIKRQDGTHILVCSLHDLALSVANDERTTKDRGWPCQQLIQQHARERIDRLLSHAGLQRFEQKMQSFVVQLRTKNAIGGYDLYDSSLIPALAEGLAYGRDREIFRALGLRLLNQYVPLPEPLAHTAQPSPLDTTRLQALVHILEHWQRPGIWLTLRRILLSQHNVAHSIIQAALRTLFCDQGMSLARADILICNIVLPIAAAIARIEQNSPLAERAEQLYLHHPGLPPNYVTRTMCAQLQIDYTPHGSCRQQGLHYIYQQTCKAKLCNLCLVGKIAI